MILFVVGTGTGVGKTIVAGTLLRGLSALGHRIAYCKLVQTGPRDEDLRRVREIAPGCSTIPTFIQYPLPMSPDQAARKQREEEGDSPCVTVHELTTHVRSLTKQHEIVLLEAAGGLMVPLNEQGEHWIDVLQQLEDVQVVLVGHSQLGTLNHSYLSIDALEMRGITPLALILSGEPHVDNEKSIRRDRSHIPLFALTRIYENDEDAMQHQAKQLARDVWEVSQKRRSDQNLKCADLLERDARCVWHPFTQHKSENAPLPVVGARGIYLHLSDGRRVMDGMSSWWVNTLGHGRTEIGRAIARQQQQLDHIAFAGATHPSAVELASILVDWAGPSFSRVFYSDNGSTAVEVALKMAFQACQHRGEKKRTRYVALRGSYHGDTVGAMSLGAATGFHDPFQGLFFPCRFVSPLTSHKSSVCPGGIADAEAKFTEIESLFVSEGDSLCALVVEPLLQGAGGMLMHDRAWLLRLCQRARECGILVIFDEVFTGLGRIGERFAFSALDFVPDIACIAKGLTGGNLPLAATLASESLFSAFLDDSKERAFLHGHSFTANPVACAAALTALRLMEKENVLENVRQLECGFQDWLRCTGERLGVENGRVLGSVLAFEIPGSGDGFYFKGQGQRLTSAALERGLLIRPLGNTVYLAPPLVTSATEQREMLGMLTEVVRVSLG